MMQRRRSLFRFSGETHSTFLHHFHATHASSPSRAFFPRPRSAKNTISSPASVTLPASDYGSNPNIPSVSTGTLLNPISMACSTR